jgi:hypothetical protein
MSKVIQALQSSQVDKNHPHGKILSLTVDSDASGDKTQDGCKGTVNSMNKMPNGNTLRLDGVISDSGGGFVVKHKKGALVERGRCRPNGLVANCCLYDKQPTGTAPMQKRPTTSTYSGVRTLAEYILSEYVLSSVRHQPYSPGPSTPSVRHQS